MKRQGARVRGAGVRGAGVRGAKQAITHAVAVDPEIKAANLRRLKRIEGQVRGLQKMVADDRYCPDIIAQVASVQEALRSVGRQLLRNHLAHCVADAHAHGPEQAGRTYDELLELVYRHLR